MTAVPLALILIATLAVLVAATPGAFSFDRWPDAPKGALSEREVAVDVPVRAEPTARADARRRPAVERESTTVVVHASPRDALERRRAPAVVPSAPRFVADAEPAEDGKTARPVGQETAPDEATPAPLPVPELPALPALPAKELPEDPEESAPEWPGAPAALPHGRDRDDQD